MRWCTLITCHQAFIPLFDSSSSFLWHIIATFAGMSIQVNSKCLPGSPLHKVLFWEPILLVFKFHKSYFTISIHVFLGRLRNRLPSTPNVKTFFTQSSSVLRFTYPNQATLLLKTSPIHSTPNLFCKSAMVILSRNLTANISLAFSFLFFLISSYIPPTCPKFLHYISYNFSHV